ncbi:unnamed protein product [Cuscuta europaea]|uniref:Uncharacterized protein n=1 Tax=Cuscuta europaea TaxID=41803 RepID=A0A9P1DYD3_CUSEU|nr:unnamed protein product [Cuscuta europaea]
MGMSRTAGPFDSPAAHGFMASFLNAPEQGRSAFFQGNSVALPPNGPPASLSSNKGLETGHGGYYMDSRDAKTNLAQTMPLPPLPPLPPHMHQLKRGRSYSGDAES